MATLFQYSAVYFPPRLSQKLAFAPDAKFRLLRYLILARMVL